MRQLFEITQFCNQFLNISQIKDFPGAINGLQFENSGKITKIGAAVDASVSAFDEAIRKNINLLIVHHGLFWHPQHPVVGTIYKKYKQLFDNDIAIYSAHLPLDTHKEIGNNAILAQKCNLTPLFWDLEYEGNTFSPICAGIPRDKLRQKLKNIFPNTFKSIEFGSSHPQKIALLCGSGNTGISILEKNHCDTFVCGELKHEYFAYAQEKKLNIYPCGHYETETFGVCALAQKISEKFNLPWEFLKQDCPL